MIFVFSIIIPIIVSGFYFLRSFLRDRKDKKKKINDDWVKAFLAREVIYLAAEVVLCLLASIFSFQYETYSNSNIIVGFVFISLVARYPVEITSIKKGETWKSWVIKGLQAAIALAGFFLELGLFSKSGETYLLSGLRLGTFFTLSYSIGHFEKFFDEDYEDKRLLAIRLGCALATITFLIVTFFLPTKFYDGYPFREDLEYITDRNPYLYYNVFDAFQHGQLSLRIDANPALATLENPYDYSSRSGMYYLWDTVYYNGKYYSYFGVAPIFLVMYPVYILSGFSYVPNGLFMLIMAIFLYTFGMFRLVKALEEKYHTKTPAWFFYVFVILVVISSLGLSFIPKQWTDWKYRIPFAYAVVGITFFLFAFFEGLRDDKHRLFYWIISSTAYVLIMGSRPEVGLIAILVVPFFVGYIRDAIRFNKKEYWKPLICYGCVLAFGGILLAGYNFLRFGNPLEFGSNYQLTVMDTSINKLNAQGFVNGFYHYFLQLPTFTKDFPIFEISYVKLSNETHPYIKNIMGLLMNPFVYVFLLLPFGLIKEKKISNWLYLYLPPILLVIFAGILYCLGGVCARYSLYLWPLATIWSISIVLSVLPIMSKNKYLYYGFLSLVLILVALGTFTAFNYLYNSFDGLIRNWVK